jgi:stage V sporulation protein B
VRFIFKRLVIISVPITISACIIPLAQFIDSALMVNRMVISGLDRDTATSLYGIFSGMVIRLINIPTALALAISMSLVPAVSSAKALEDHSRIVRECSTGIRYAFLIGFPCAIGMSMMAKQILSFFYLETLSPERLQTASELLTVSALTVVLFTVVQATSSILQGLHRQKIPMYTMIAGVLCKIVLNYVLIGIPGINIHGGPVASLVCYSVSMIPNLYFCCKFAEMKMDWERWIIRPGLATSCMAAFVWLLRTLLPDGRLSTVFTVGTGIAVYLIAAFLCKAITKSDIRSMLRRS